MEANRLTVDETGDISFYAPLAPNVCGTTVGNCRLFLWNTVHNNSHYGLLPLPILCTSVVKL